MSALVLPLHIELSGSTDTDRCDCCGHISRKVWGEVLSGNDTIAVYFVHWTVDHVDEHGAHFDLILGPWGEGTDPTNRTVARLEHRSPHDGPGVMVIDAALTNGLNRIAAHALTRADIIGTPRAADIFAIYDAIVLQDPRLGELGGTIDE